VRGASVQSKKAKLVVQHYLPPTCVECDSHEGNTRAGGLNNGHGMAKNMEGRHCQHGKHMRRVGIRWYEQDKGSPRCQPSQ
jgi:hypothetical protein